MRSSYLSPIVLVFAGPWLFGQGTTVSTSGPGAQFSVDGEVYSAAQTFLWPAGSKHILYFLGGPLPGNIVLSTPSNYVQLTSDQQTIYAFSGWVESSGLLHTNSDPVLTVTADPSVTSITANVSLLYRVQLNFASGAPAGVLPVCGGSPGGIPSNVFVPGVIYLANQCFWGPVSAYFPPGPLTLNAFPFPGFVFAGWLNGPSSPNQYLSQIDLTGPLTLYPYFEIAKRVRFITSPPGWPVVVDHAQVPTLPNPNYQGACPTGTALPVFAPATIAPMCLGDFDFAPGSPHQVGAASPQWDGHSKPWVFTGWTGTNSIQNGVYLTDNNANIRETVTANYAQAAQVSFVTAPPGLTLDVDGASNWRQYNFYWAPGTTHQFSAVQQQTGADTRIYVLQGWSNGGLAAQALTVSEAEVATGLVLTANYKALNRLVVQSVPAGLTLQVDGQACLTPCHVDHTVGTPVAVSAPSSIAQDAYTRFDLTGWSDGGSAGHTVTLTADTTTITASFQERFRLLLSADPAGAAVFQASPASVDSYYTPGTTVNLAARPSPGYSFRRWDGALSGTWPSGQVTMSSPQQAIARMDKIPYIAPAGIQSAAGVTPDTGVAPGETISIFGENLAPGTGSETGTPLPQSLAGTTVAVEGRFLVLLYVSPQQINAILPSDLPEGQHTLTVYATGLPDVTGTFTAIRNAPALFPRMQNGVAFATATHADGSALNSASPAQAGENITIVGTGFGPCEWDAPYGYPVPAAPLDPLIDAPTVALGDMRPPASWAGCMAGQGGYSAVRFLLPAEAPSGVSLPLQIEVNGHKSNTVSLPVQ